MKLKFALLLILVAGCASGPKTSAPVTSAIVFVPGYYGTALKDARSGRRVFVTAGGYLFGSTSVGLHTSDLQTPPAPELVTDGVLERVRVIPGLFSVDVYGQFLNELERIARDIDAELVRFAYDWRQDLVETARRLDAEIERLRARGITDIQIVAHSMGCVVTTYYLGYGGQEPADAVLDWRGAGRIARAVLMAGPYRGAFSLFRNMQTGGRIGSNVDYLPAEAVASMPASYQLLPMLDFHLYDHQGHVTSFPIAEEMFWERLNLGLLKNKKLDDEVRTRRQIFVAAQLARARALAGRLEFKGPPPPASLRLLQLVGSGRGVVDGAYFDAATGAFTFDTDDLKSRGLAARPLFVDGDGSVSTTSARLPAPLRPRAVTMTTHREHDRVFEDEAFRRELRQFSAR